MFRARGDGLPVSAIFVLGLLSACSRRDAPGQPAPAPASAASITVPASAKVKLERETSVRESGALVLARVGGALRTFIADEDDGAIVEIDRTTGAVVQTTKLGSRPRDLLVLADGRLATTLPDASAVAIYSRDEGSLLHEDLRVKTPAEPIAMALDPADTTLYVSSGASHSLVTFSITSDGSKLEERARTLLGREPRAVLVLSLIHI